MNENGNLQEAYLRAYHFAARAHLGQLYPGTQISYIMHLSFVSMEVLTALSVETHRDGALAIQCALLHDVIEDTPVTHDEVIQNFGVAVADGVLALTKDSALPKDKAMTDSLRRIQAQPSEVGMVKLADRITNLQRPPSHWTQDKCARYRREAQKILAALKDASPLLASRLSGKIEAYTRWTEGGVTGARHE